MILDTQKHLLNLVFHFGIVIQQTFEKFCFRLQSGYQTIVAALHGKFDILRVVHLLDRTFLAWWRQIIHDPLREFLVGGRRATLTISGLEQEDPVASDLRQPHAFKHAIVVPLLGVFHVKLVILVAMREDEDAVLRVDVGNRCPPDRQNVLVATVRSDARLEDEEGQGEGLGLRIGAAVEPLYPVGGGNARVVQTGRVD